MASTRKSSPFTYKVIDGVESGGTSYPADIDQKDVPQGWIGAENRLYGNQTDEDYSGKWLLTFPRDQINAKWDLIKQGVKEGRFWICKVSPRNDFDTHLICVYAPFSENIHTLIELYNNLIDLGLADPNIPLKYKTDMQTFNPQLGEFKYTSDELPGLMLTRLQEQIDQVPAEHENRQEFVDALQTLKDQLASDIKSQQENDVPNNKILRSPAMKVAMETAEMLVTVNKTSNRVTPEAKIRAIGKFESSCTQPESGLRKFAKAVATVVIAAVGFVLGAAIGLGIGMLAGAWTGPGAAVTAALGLLKGAATGATIGLAVGTAATGVAAGTASGYLLFRKNKRERAIDDVAKQAEQFVKKNNNK